MSDFPTLNRLLDALPADLSGPDRALIRRAYTRAMAEHGDQIRADGSPRAHHVARVALSLVTETGVTSPTEVAAALLHDVAENTPTSIDQLRRDFGGRVADLVDSVTNRPGDDAGDSVRRALEGGSESLRLRLIDRIDGVRQSRGRSPDGRHRFLSGTRAAHLPAARAHCPRIADLLERALADAERF